MNMGRLSMALLGLLLLGGCSSTGQSAYGGYYPEQYRYDGRQYPAAGAQPQGYEVERLRQEVAQLREAVSRIERRLAEGERVDTEQEALMGDFRMALASMEQRLSQRLSQNMDTVDRTPERIANPKVETPRSSGTPLYRNAGRTNSRSASSTTNEPRGFVDTTDRQQLTRQASPQSIPSRFTSPRSVAVTTQPKSEPTPTRWAVVLPFSDRDSMLKVNRFLNGHKINDKSLSQSSGRYFIYLGYFSQQRNAERRRDEILNKTGLEPEIIGDSPNRGGRSGSGV